MPGKGKLLKSQSSCPLHYLILAVNLDYIYRNEICCLNTILFLTIYAELSFIEKLKEMLVFQ